MDALLQDIGYAFRGLRRSPGLTATILVTLSLGIGVNAAMFTVLDRVLLQAPPGVVDPSRVRRVVAPWFSPRNHYDYISDQFSLTDYETFNEILKDAGRAEGYDLETDKRVGVQQEQRAVSFAMPGLFPLLGVRAYRGRLFSSTENEYGAPARVVVLGYDYWRHEFAGDDHAIGQTLLVDTTRYRIIGVMPPRFVGLDLSGVDVWAPFAARSAGYEGSWWSGDGKTGFQIMNLVIRLRQGDVEAVEARLYQQMRRNYDRPESMAGPTRVMLAPILQARGPIGLGARDDRGVTLMIRLAVAAGLILVVATSNVASLLLMRALRRRREIAVRVALGISPSRLGRQVLIESMVLGVAAATVAILIAFWSGGVLRARLLSGIRWPATVVDTRVVVLATTLALLAACVAALAPLSFAHRADLIAALKSGSSESGRPRARFRIALLVTQTALSVVMVASAGAFLQTLRHAIDLDMGFDANRLITFQWFRVDPATLAATVNQIRALPDVERVALANNPAVLGGQQVSVRLPGGDSIPWRAGPQLMIADTGFARTIGMHLVAGRLFSHGDDNGETVLINETMAKRFWHGESPIGRCVQLLIGQAPACRTIVGVVADTRWDLSAKPVLVMYSTRDLPTLPCGCSSLFIRTRSRATAAAIAEVRKLLEGRGGEVDYPPTPRTVLDRIEPQIRPWRVAATMFLVFAIVSLTAASAGIYGLVGYEVTQRTHEFGVRLTLGATAHDILSLVLGSALRITAAGVMIGLAIAALFGRSIQALLFETSPYDVTMLGATVIVLGVAAVLASLGPAVRAARVDPAISLRAE